jgi:hypothetical protein
VADAYGIVDVSPYTGVDSIHTVQQGEALLAAAAHDVLVALYPAQVAALDQQYAAYLNAIPGHHEGKLNGIAVGQQTAAGILALRANDGRNAGTGWTPPPPGPGIWQPTPPGFLPPATPWIRLVTPWTMTSPSQFRVLPPPALDSAVWVRTKRAKIMAGGRRRTLARNNQILHSSSGPGVHPML